MPQKTGRYPPIHDQIDTPTDFSVAVWEKRGGGRGETEAGHREKPSTDEIRKSQKSSTCHSTDGGNSDIKTIKSGVV